MPLKDFDQYRYKKFIFIFSLILLITWFCSLGFGSNGFSLLSLLDFHQFPILKYRFFRGLLAIIAGSSLAASGASLQALFQNQLADPHLFGISGGAALGAALAICIFDQNLWLSPNLGAVLGGSLAFGLIFFYLRDKSLNSLTNSLLVGILINAMAASLITIVKSLISPHKTQSLLFWLVGHIGIISDRHLALIIPLWLIGLCLLWRTKGALELLSFGYIEAQTMGINYRSIIKIAIIANCILIGNTVAFSGMIGFVGLVIPNLIRIAIFPDLRFLLPASIILGGLCLLIFDVLSRISFYFFQTEIAVGALCALFLSPLFFFILLRARHDS